MWDDISAWLAWIDVLSAPVWLNLGFIALGVIGMAYGLWPRGEVAKAVDREWSEEGALALQEQRHNFLDKSLLPFLLYTLVTIVVAGFLYALFGSLGDKEIQRLRMENERLQIEQSSGSEEAPSSALADSSSS